MWQEHGTTQPESEVAQLVSAGLINEGISQMDSRGSGASPPTSW